MAAKDADLARDFSLDFVYISMPTVADMEIELSTTPLMSDGDRTAELFLIGLPKAGGTVYRMRGIDGDLGYPVYWESTIVDSAGVDYPGNSAALSDVVLSEKIAT